MTTKINQRVTENKVESNIKECRYVDCSKFKSCFSKFDVITAQHLNISSLSKHIDSLSNMLEQLALDFKVIAISETRIRHDSIPHNLEIPNYECISTKTEAAAGGTAIYIHKSITYKLRSDLNSYKPKFLESTFIEIIRPKKGNIVIGTIYKYQNMQSCEFVEKFFSSDFINKEQKMCVLLGDLTLISYIKKVEQFLLLLIL